MIKNIQQIGTNATVFVSKIKPRKALSYIGICTLAPIASFYNGKVVAPAVKADIARSQNNIKEVVVKPVKKMIHESCFDTKTFQINWENYIKNHNYNYNPVFSLKDDILEKNIKLLLKVMNEDKACKVLNKEKLARQIVQVANDYNINPLVLASIAKKESHFTQEVSGKAFKGIMQIGKISIDDMYQKHREHIYMPYLKDIKEKYKSSVELFKAVEDDSLLNIRVGALVYLSKLKKAKGNVFEAIKIYNNSSLKNKYANKVYNDIKQYTDAVI